jgi:hypothetical protein
MVPFSLLGMWEPPAPVNGSDGPRGPQAAGRSGAGADPPGAEGWFIISMVPLNFGAATPFR